MAHVLHAPRSTNALPVLAIIGDVLSVIGAAIRAAAAVESHRSPHAADLAILGIARNALPVA